MTKSSALNNEANQDITKETCHNVNADIIVDNDNKHVTNDCVANQIIEFLLE